MSAESRGFPLRCFAAIVILVNCATALPVQGSSHQDNSLDDTIGAIDSGDACAEGNDAVNLLQVRAQKVGAQAEIIREGAGWYSPGPLSPDGHAGKGDDSDATEHGQWFGSRRRNSSLEELLSRSQCFRRTQAAKEQFNFSMMLAFASLTQRSDCASSDDNHIWTCPECEKVGFEVVPDTARLVRRAQLGQTDATMIYIARLRRLAPKVGPVYKPRLRTPVEHVGEPCLAHCGERSGWCGWCGIGQACCHPSNTSQNAAECIGVAHRDNASDYHQCVETRDEQMAAPLQPLDPQGEDCYQLCGKAVGFCHACGSGNACCHPGLAEQPLECQGVHNFTTGGYECVTPGSLNQTIDPLDFGCALSFRGTRNVANTVEDISFMPKIVHADCEGCKVHRGFLDVWQEVERKVVRVLDDIGCRPGAAQSSLLMTGHSLGAAVATLAMFTLQSRGYSVEQAYVFASPRVGNAKFARMFMDWFSAKLPLFHVTHSTDIISQVPPRPMFWHTGSEVFFPGEDPMNYVICGCQESWRCQRRYPLWRLMLTRQSARFHCNMPLGREVGNICRCDGKNG